MGGEEWIWVERNKENLFSLWVDRIKENKGGGRGVDPPRIQENKGGGRGVNMGGQDIHSSGGGERSGYQLLSPLL